MKVCTAYTRDVGRGVVRIDYDTMSSFDASTGDVFEIKGERSTVVKCLPLYPSDDGKGIIRIDRLIRNNAGLKLGDIALLRKVKSWAAEKVVVSSHEVISEIPGERVLDDIQEIFHTPYGRSYLAHALESVPLIEGDHVWVPYFGNKITFQVIETSPATDAVLVTAKTNFYFDDELVWVQNKTKERTKSL